MGDRSAAGAVGEWFAGACVFDWGAAALFVGERRAVVGRAHWFAAGFAVRAAARLSDWGGAGFGDWSAAGAVGEWFAGACVFDRGAAALFVGERRAVVGRAHWFAAGFAVRAAARLSGWGPASLAQWIATGRADRDAAGGDGTVGVR